MRLIDADAALDAFMEILDRPYHAEFLYTDEICRVLGNLPTAQPQWIPVSERLPERGKEVLFCDDDGDIYVGHHAIDYWWSVDDKVKSVVAWMPLPRAFEGEA